MSLASCRECEAFIDTDTDPAACVDDDFVCESCREDEAIDLYVHETAEFQAKLINELRDKNARLLSNFEDMRKENEELQKSIIPARTAAMLYIAENQKYKEVCQEIIKLKENVNNHTLGSLQQWVILLGNKIETVLAGK